jgi:hypothetical protein
MAKHANVLSEPMQGLCGPGVCIFFKIEIAGEKEYFSSF